MRSSPRFLAIALLGLAGCIPLPAALPPAKASLGIGAAVGNVVPDDMGNPLSEAEPVAIGRVGIVPQSAWAEQHRRPFEVEAGYGFQVFTGALRQNRNRHGAYLGVSVLAGDWFVGDNWRARITMRAFGEYFVLQAHPGDGAGGGWALGFELARYAGYTPDESEGGITFLGWMAGEWSIGAELFGGVYSVGGAEYGTVGFALTGRWAGLFGIGLVPLTGSF